MYRSTIYFWAGAFLTTIGFSLIHVGLGFAWAGSWCLFLSFCEFCENDK